MSGSVKICPSCGKAFTCNGEDDCWCENYQIHKKDYLEIIKKYNDCLCPDCLGRYVEK